MRDVHLHARFREASGAGGDGRTLEGLAVPWMSPTDATETGLSEQFARGSIDPAAVVGLPLRWRHAEPIGAVTGARDTAQGLAVTARVADTTLGRDALALLRELPGLGLSVRFIEDPATDWKQTPVTYRKVDIREISLTDQPAYKDARVQKVREAMPETKTPDKAPDEAGPTPAPETRARETAQEPAPDAPAVRDVTGTDLGTQIERLREQVATLSAGVGTGRGTDADVSPLARFRSMGEYAQNAYRSTEGDPVARSRALAENIVSESPGVTQPTWLSDIKRLVDRGRPFLSNLGGPSALPPAPETPSWPYFDGTLLNLVNVQSAELAEVTSVQVEIKRATGTISTYAGGTRSSFQLLERSSPAYYDAYLRILLMAWARRTETAALAAAEAGSTADIDNVYDADAPQSLFTAVVQASAALEDATGAGADVVVVNPTSWATIAGALDTTGRPLFGASNPMNAPGVPTQPGVLGLAVAGVPLVRGAASMTAAVLVTNRAAFGWLEEGPRVITQDQVAVLGRDTAIYGYTSPNVYAPAGIITITPSE